MVNPEREETMKNLLMRGFTKLLCLLAFTTFLVPRLHADDGDRPRIERLLKAVESSQTIFVRNGTEYTAVDAAKHLRYKWGKAGKQIRSAEEFVDILGSRSSASGKPYQVILKNGRRMDAGPWLHGILREIDRGGIR